MIIFTGLVGSHPAGDLIAGISPTNIFTCLGNALMQVPMFDVYGTRGGGLMVDRCEILHVSIISTNRGLVFASTTCDALAGLSHAAVVVVNRRRALLWVVCCYNVPFELWYRMLCSESRYHSDCWWCCSRQLPSCGTPQPSGAKYSSASFHAFPEVGRC
jgi:hypothetical protein